LSAHASFTPTSMYCRYLLVGSLFRSVSVSATVKAVSHQFQPWFRLRP